eukprot:gene44445-59309_t
MRPGSPLPSGRNTMIDLYTSPTPNGWKASVALEELGLDYEVHAIDLLSGAQRAPDYLALNPNGRIPTIVDRDEGNFAVFESGAILVYLAEKTGRLMPADAKGRSLVLQWLMFQMGGLGPMLGQAHHFRIYAPEKIDYAVNRYTNEAKRLYGVLDQQLKSKKWIAGGEYSIADMAIFPWLRSWQNQGIDWTDCPRLKTCLLAPTDAHAPLRADKAKQTLFGPAQYKKR